MGSGRKGSLERDAPRRPYLTFFGPRGEGILAPPARVLAPGDRFVHRAARRLPELLDHGPRAALAVPAGAGGADGGDGLQLHSIHSGYLTSSRPPGSVSMLTQFF